MDKRNEAKSKIQKAALNAWAKKSFRGTLELCTGAGKTYCAIQAVEYMFKKKPDAEILIITPTEIIRDDVFPKEFKKWKVGNLLKKVTIKCIQTVYKWEDKHYDLVIADEIHNYLPEEEDYKSKAYEYHKFFENNTMDRILGLSALIPILKVSVCRKIAPVVFRLTTDKGVDLGVISPYIEFNIPINMEKEELKAFQRIQMIYFGLETTLGGSRFAFKRAGSIIAKIKKIDVKDRTPKEKDDYQKAVQFWKVMQKRKSFLYGLTSKNKAVGELIDALGISKSVIFSQSTLFADLLCHGRDDMLSYHSKTKKRDKVMSKFKDGRTRFKHLSTCMAVNEGMDLPKLPAIIIASRTSGPKAHIQRRGRCLRFEPGKTSYVFNLYVANTQDEKWLRKSQATTNSDNIVWVNSIEEAKSRIEKEKSINESIKGS